jgi:hypothetical protein
MTLVRVMLAVLVPLVGIGALIAALESVAPNPSGRYAALLRTAAVQESPDPEHPSPPCVIP